MNALNSNGPISWMASNPVAANLLMALLLVGGLLMALRIRQEVFPEFERDFVNIGVAYPGAGPEEIDRGIVEAVEEEVRGLDNVKRVLSQSAEGRATVSVEMLSGTDLNKALQDVKSAVDRITSFPQDAERPVVSLASSRRAVLSLIIYGQLPEGLLRQLAEQARDELLALPGLTTVDLVGVRPPEISVEVPQQTLRAYNLSLEDIAQRIARHAVEIPGGSVKSAAGEILLRLDERRTLAGEFANIPIISQSDGSQVLLQDVAELIDGFRDLDAAAYFFGEPAVRLVVYRTGEQTPIEISQIVQAYEQRLNQRLPPGVSAVIWGDRSEIYRDRINLLLRNAALGLTLVLIILGLFLAPRLAFWVTMGIPISFFGAFLLMPAMDATINMISLFAFIISIGIVVDDAIVVGENIFEQRQRGLSYRAAAITGARQVKVPVTFAILTNIAAFSPLFFLGGSTGNFYKVIPAIVIAVFIVSWVESLFILPAHLAHESTRSRPLSGLLGRWEEHRQRFGRWLSSVIQNKYLPTCQACVSQRYLTMAAAVALLLACFGYVRGGHMDFTFMPKVDSDTVTANAVLPYDASVAETQAVAERLYRDAEELLAELGGRTVTRGMFIQIGSNAGGGPGAASAGSGSNLCAVQVFLVPSDQRSFTSSQFVSAWRRKSGDLYGLESLNFRFNIGPAAGADIDIEVSHRDRQVLEQAALELAAALENFAGVSDVNSGFTLGKPQLSFKVRPEAAALGLTATELARQLRAAFYGARAFRQQRGRDEIWVMVRLPEAERRSEYYLERLMIRTPGGGEVPLGEVADIERGRAYTVIERSNGRRVLHVTADVDERTANADRILQDLGRSAIPALQAKYPGLQVGFEGIQRDQREGISSLITGFTMAMIVVFAMLAIPLGSYWQPVVIMSAIPFGFVGAVLGHIIMGYDLSVVSLMGFIALSGVVVNDSLVLVFYANDLRKEGLSAFAAILQAGARRFRPILLTSLTTFFGLAPMIFETSVQARFLIPMAISLGFGVLSATVIALFLVPALYMILEDAKAALGRRFSPPPDLG